MDLAKAVSQFSKHPEIRIGAIAIGPFGQVQASGFNGYPRGVVDEERKRQANDYSLTIHAEENVICNASLTGISLYECSIYIYGFFPCLHCAMLLSQVGVSRIVFQEVALTEGVEDKWTKLWPITEVFLCEVDIEVVKIY
jgi:dCMP deaminase